MDNIAIANRGEGSKGIPCEARVYFIRYNGESESSLVQAGRVELVVAGAALELGQRARRRVDDGVADRALLDALEDLVDVLAP